MRASKRASERERAHGNSWNLCRDIYLMENISGYLSMTDVVSWPGWVLEYVQSCSSDSVPFPQEFPKAHHRPQYSPGKWELLASMSCLRLWLHTAVWFAHLMDWIEEIQGAWGSLFS